MGKQAWLEATQKWALVSAVYTPLPPRPPIDTSSEEMQAEWYTGTESWLGPRVLLCL